MARSGRPGALRIVAGEFGGRRLQGPPQGAETRPTTERTREAIFSILAPVEGDVLDLFCGSGALGLEALSRGAESVTLVDLDTKLARANVGTLAAGDRCEVVRADAVDYLASAKAEFDLILCDPPYRLAARLAPELDNVIADRIREGGRLVMESSPDTPIHVSLPLLRERRYGATLVRVFGAPQ